MRLGLDEAQPPGLLARGAAGSPARRARSPRRDRWLERLLGRARGTSAPRAPARRRARSARPAPWRRSSPALLQPLAGEPVAERAIGLGEHRVGRLAHERVANDVLALAAGRGARGARRPARARRAARATRRPRRAGRRRRGAPRRRRARSARRTRSRRAARACASGPSASRRACTIASTDLGQRVAPGRRPTARISSSR